MKARILITVSLLLLGCDRPVHDGNRSAAKLDQDSAETLFKRQIESDGSAVFQSRGGDLLGMDSDARLSFEGDGQVELTEYGIGPMYYRGSYSSEPSGRVRLDLPSYPAKWPVMMLFTRDQHVFLGREDGKQDLELGGRAAATELGDMPPFWPFRMIYHSARMNWGSVVGLTEGWIAEGKRVVFVPRTSSEEWDPGMPRLEFLGPSTLSYSPSGSGGPTFNGSYDVDDHGTIRVQMDGAPERLPEVVWFCEGDDSRLFLGSRRDLHERQFRNDSSSEFVRAMPWKMLQPPADNK